MHSWSSFGARTNHGQTQIHKTHHNPDLGEPITFLFIVFFVSSHGACTQMLFCIGVAKLKIPKFPKLGLLQLWRPITSYANLQLEWGLKQSCHRLWVISNDMWHATYTQANQGNSWFLMVESLINNLTLDLSIGHNLCFKYPNGSCEPISDNSFPLNFLVI